MNRELLHLDKVETVLDYGCGQSRLVDWLARMNDATATRFDPAVPEHATPPTGRFDAVIDTDILEHIPEEDVDDFLRKIRALTDNAYFNVSVREAIAILPNGGNVHCTVKESKWWGQKIANTFGLARRASSNDVTSLAWVTWKKIARTALF